MPRVVIMFSTGGSPKSQFWPDDPKKALTEIAEKNNAIFVEDSLVFAPGGKVGEAVFETTEPDEDSPATKLFQLATELDALEARLHIDVDRWKRL